MMAETADTLLQGLNAEQLAAVTYPPAPLLILAGAGSGKTRVLTTRIAWLLHTRQVRPREILAVTFTNKAAKEMRSRIEAMVAGSLQGMWIGTFHGLCHRMLRQHWREAGLPQAFQIMDSAEQLALIKRLLKQLDISEEALPPRLMQGFINAQKEEGLRAGAIDAPDPIAKRLIRVYAEYEQVCEREGVLDFAELLLKSYELLNGNTDLLRRYQMRFRHILADEFQDTNVLQYRWLMLLAGGGAALCAVGDDDQSIYRFRGARVGNMADLMRDLGIGDALRLEQNYRSTGTVLAAANALIARNRGRLGKNLRTTAGAGEPIRLFSAADDIAEAAFVVNEIRKLLQQGTSAAQIAVLYRSNAQSRVLEQALFREKIAYRIYGGLRFYERAEIKHALAYLRLAVNPADDNAFLRIVNMPPRGIGERTVAAVREQAAANGVPLLAAAQQMAGKSAKVAAFAVLMARFQALAGTADLPDLLAEIISSSGLYDYFAKQNNAAERERTENLDELLNAARLFRPDQTAVENEAESREAGAQAILLAFLSNAALEAGDDEAETDNGVSLMTVHAAKGLEFDAVFITGLEEGRFPSEQSVSDAEAVEEERRLMYVALTRARRRLYLSLAQRRMLHGAVRTGVVSRFIGEIPPELLQNVSPAKTVIRDNVVHNQAKTSAPIHGFYAGQRVHHGKFGAGVVVSVRDAGASARVKVDFDSWGSKELDTAFANLMIRD